MMAYFPNNVDSRSSLCEIHINRAFTRADLAANLHYQVEDSHAGGLICQIVTDGDLAYKSGSLKALRCLKRAYNRGVHVAPP